jgi:nitrite reductase/ring-hydroxylating ferredoxin subunit
VNVIIHLNDPAYVKLNAVGGWAYVDGGVRGIIVYRRATEEFAAFDRNCTYMPSNECATVYVDKSGSTAVDTCCGSKFLIYDGTVQKGPATIGLKPYHTTLDGSVLYISN